MKILIKIHKIYKTFGILKKSMYNLYLKLVKDHDEFIPVNPIIFSEKNNCPEKVPRTVTKIFCIWISFFSTVTLWWKMAVQNSQVSVWWLIFYYDWCCIIQFSRSCGWWWISVAPCDVAVKLFIFFHPAKISCYAKRHFNAGWNKFNLKITLNMPTNKKNAHYSVCF